MIDFNGFIGPWPYWDIPHKTPESVLELMSRYQINVLAICSTRSIFSDWRQGNEEAIAAAQRFPSRFVPFVSLNPILPAAELVRFLEDYKRRNVKGIRLYPQHQGYSLTLHSGAAKILEAAQRLDLTVVLPIRVIMNWGLPLMDPATIEVTVPLYPKVNFILSGLNYDMTLWAYDFMRRTPNVCLEISGLQGFRAVSDAVQAVGAQRVLFGSGIPLLYPACSLEKLRFAKLTHGEENAIAEGNARRLLHI